jgi:Flp pilus assembly pilin Flp
MLLHFIKLHWRTVLAVVVLAVAIWFCLPAGLRAKISGRWKKIGHAIGNFQARVLLTVIYSRADGCSLACRYAILRRLVAHQEAP